MDWGGKQHIAPGLGDVVDNLIITGDFSGGRFVFPSKDTTAASVLRAFKRQKAAQDAVNGARVARIRLDGELNCEEINAWCAENNIHPDFSPPHEPQSNGRAEASVGVAQALAGRTVRRRGMGCASASTRRSTRRWCLTRCPATLTLTERAAPPSSSGLECLGSTRV